jgi:predicted transcriptional regulator
MQTTYQLWEHASDSLSEITSNIYVKDIMYTPTEGEYVSADSTLRQAIHQMVVGEHQSLLVAQDRKVIGILRFIDVFNKIAALIRG